MKLFVMLLVGFSLLFSSVNINTANSDELSSLKGIGQSKAEAIVSFRKGHCFKSIDELSSVKGIGSKTIENNRANLTASKCK